MKIPFNRPYITGTETNNILQAHLNGALSGDGPFTRKCHRWLETNTKAKKALLTHSCTAALEMSALLIDIQPGDEIIMPSYTFVSTANAFALRGGVPVFVDIRPDTLNIDETKIEDAINTRTRAIVPVHYAGISCEMDSICNIAKRHDILVIEDAAQGIMSTYKDKPLGAIGDLGTFSFHETKNVISGEGGALLINHPSFLENAEIIRDKGTDRSRFFKGKVDKYTWQRLGSSFLPGELIAAFLWAQLQASTEITQKRLGLWNKYHELLFPLEEQGLIRRPIIQESCVHNAHMYYILLNPKIARDQLLTRLRVSGVDAVFHYVPLHTSPAAKGYCRTHGMLNVTEDVSERILRLPLWIGLSEKEQIYIANTLSNLLH